MSIFFSRQCEYALQAVMYLALKQNGRMTSIKELSLKLDIPYHFVGKILQELAHKGLLVSQKGPTGGFTLAKPAHETSLFQIVEAIDGAEFRNSCVLGYKECSGEKPCTFHKEWTDLRGGIYGMLANKSLADMAQGMKKPEYGFGIL